MMLVKEVRFDDKMYIKKYLLPEDGVNYSDIEWISLNVIKINGLCRNISLHQMDNSIQLSNKIKENMLKYKGTNELFNKEQIVNEITDSISIYISTIVTSIVFIVICIFNFIPNRLNLKIAVLVIWIAITLIVYLVRRNK